MVISGTICCPSTAPLVASAGSQVCVNTCSPTIYFVNGTINQCNATCAQPFAIQTTTLGSSGAYLCSACASPNFVNRADSKCVTSCGYVNTSQVNSSWINVCEVTSDSTNCHYQQYLNATAYTCNSTCNVVISGTICCPSSAPLVASAGSQVCVNTCSPTIYYINGTINQCNATCALPFGIQTTGLGSPVAYTCSACANFVQRSNSSCVTSCAYVNSTTVNSTAVVVCETAANATNCPYYTYLNGTAFTCLSTCGSLLTGQTCCTTSLPLVPSAGSIICQNSCPANIYFLNGTIN